MDLKEFIVDVEGKSHQYRFTALDYSVEALADAAYGSLDDFKPLKFKTRSGYMVIAPNTINNINIWPCEAVE